MAAGLASLSTFIRFFNLEVPPYRLNYFRSKISIVCPVALAQNTTTV